MFARLTYTLYVSVSAVNPSTYKILDVRQVSREYISTLRSNKHDSAFACQEPCSSRSERIEPHASHTCLQAHQVRCQYHIQCFLGLLFQDSKTIWRNLAIPRRPCDVVLRTLSLHTTVSPLARSQESQDGQPPKKKCECLSHGPDVAGVHQRVAPRSIQCMM
jgi:hypothetical protein